MVSVDGTYFRVHCHGGNEVMAGIALEAVDRVWPVVAELLGQVGKQPDGRIETHLYRTIAGYEAADLRLTGGKFQRNLAMCHHATRSAHVALQPPCSDEAVRGLGLPGQTVEMLVWESVHASRFALCPNFRSHPMWFVDGFAEYITHEVTRTPHCLAALDRPRPGTRMLRVKRLLAADKLPAADAILADAVDDLEFSDRYATRSVFFRFLMSGTRRGKMKQVTKAIVGTGGGSNYAATVLSTARRAFGKSLDRDFRRFVVGLEPRWDEVFRALDVREPTIRQIGYPDTNAIAWSREPMPGAGVKVAGRLRVLPGAGRQLNVLLKQPDMDGFYSVAFVAEKGFTVFHYTASTEEWRSLGAGNAPGFRVGIASQFAVSAHDRGMRVDLDGSHWEFDLPIELGAAVQWGLGAQAGTAGEWSELDAEPAK